MKDETGTRYLVTPSVIYSPEVAIAAFDGGESGFMHVRVDGSMVDVKMFYTDATLAHEFTEEWNKFSDSDAALKAVRTCINFMLACHEAREYVRRGAESAENADLFPNEVAEWFGGFTDNLQLIVMEITEEVGGE